ncbi:EDF1 factor, partial [Polypterus senegalus]
MGAAILVAQRPVVTARGRPNALGTLDRSTSATPGSAGEEEEGHPESFRENSRHFRHTGACPGGNARKHLELIQDYIKGAVSLHSRLESTRQKRVWRRPEEKALCVGISNMALRDSLKIDENLVLMKELEERLKKQIDKLEHLRLSIAEVKDNMTLALCPSSDCGFGAVQQQGTDLKPLIADHLEWLARLNERMEALQMNTTIFVQAVAAAQRRGEEVETTKKWAAGQNKQHVVTKNTAKLDRETEELHHERVTLEVGKVIQQGRQSKGMTQKDLATKINEKPQIIADYESGKAIPNNQVLGKIERALGQKDIQVSCSFTGQSPPPQMMDRDMMEKPSPLADEVSLLRLAFNYVLVIPTPITTCFFPSQQGVR